MKEDRKNFKFRKIYDRARNEAAARSGKVSGKKHLRKGQTRGQQLHPKKADKRVYKRRKLASAGDQFEESKKALDAAKTSEKSLVRHAASDEGEDDDKIESINIDTSYGGEIEEVDSQILARWHEKGKELDEEGNLILDLSAQPEGPNDAETSQRLQARTARVGSDCDDGGQAVHYDEVDDGAALDEEMEEQIEEEFEEEIEEELEESILESEESEMESEVDSDDLTVTEESDFEDVKDSDTEMLAGAASSGGSSSRSEYSSSDAEKDSKKSDLHAFNPKDGKTFRELIEGYDRDQKRRDAEKQVAKRPY